MAVTYVRNSSGQFEQVGPGGATTDATLSLSGKPADAAAVGSALTNYATTANMSSQLNTKVDKVEGKGLSTNDYTTTEKNKLAGIATGANKTVVDSALSSSSTNPVQNKIINNALAGKANVDHTHNTFTSLIDIGITTFPTTMKIIANTMPNGSVVTIDTRRINGVESNLSTQTISDWGNTTNGVATIMKGDSEHRVSMQIVYSVTSATGAYMEYGNYAYSENLVNWGSTEDKVSKTTLADIFGKYYDLAVTVTPGENYTAASGEATLVGNMLRVKFSADRTSAASGNIANETVATFSIAHGGKITGGFAVSIGNGTSGHLANMVVSSVSCNATALTFKITLTATGGETSSVNPFFAMPVLIDINKF